MVFYRAPWTDRPAVWTGNKLIPRSVSKPLLLQTLYPRQFFVSVSLRSDPSECFIGASETCQTLSCYLYIAQTSCSWAPENPCLGLPFYHVLHFLSTNCLLLSPSPHFVPSFFFSSHCLNFTFCFLAFWGCVLFLRRTVPLIFLYFMQCH